jgi:hypothetical protein
MVRARLRRLIVGSLTLVAAVSLPTAAHAQLTVGIGDQSPATFSDPRFAALGVKHARYIVPFDVALRSDSRRTQFDAWLAATSAHGMRPLVAFYSDAHRKPSVAAYRRAVRAFHRAYPQVTDLQTWNEVNLGVLARDPRRAAQFYRELRAAVPSGRIVAADVLDSSNMTSFLRTFRRYAPNARLWGLHNYMDANYGRTTGTRRMLRAVPGEVWMTEVGGIIHSRTRRFSEARQVASVHRTFSLARSDRRITRVYPYHWAGGQAGWDSGFIAPNGRARPALDALRAELRRTG